MIQRGLAVKFIP